MSLENITMRLDAEWDREGFLGRLRLGHFTSGEAEKFLDLLRAIHIDEKDCVPKRLVTLLWYLPSFLSWQTERVSEAGGEMKEYIHFANQVHNLLEERLGTP